MESYPLCWPEGWKRTPRHLIDVSRFKVTPDRARRNMLSEIRRLVGGDWMKYLKLGNV